MLIGAAFCASTANIWQIIGYIVLIIKIVIPLLLIVMGMVDLGKAVISSDEKAIKTATGSLIRRFIAAIAIFFIPTIVSAIFSIIGLINTTGDYNKCVECVTNVNGNICDNAVRDVVGKIDSSELE